MVSAMQTAGWYRGKTVLFIFTQEVTQAKNEMEV